MRSRWIRLVGCGFALAIAAMLLAGSVFAFLDDAPVAFDNTNNGLVDQGQFLRDKASFSVALNLHAGLGPVYNAQTCRECHQHPVTGGISQIRELMAGHFDPVANTFTGATVTINNGVQDPNLSDPPVIANRALINLRATCPAFDQDPNDTGNDAAGNPNVYDFQDHTVEERLDNATNADTTTLRTSLNLLGDGFVEAVADQTFLSIRDAQCSSAGAAGTVTLNGLTLPNPAQGICGQAVMDGVLENIDPNTGQPVPSVGRFGWKDQEASLLSFSGVAYRNEQGITNRLQPDEVTNYCNPSFVTEPNNPGNPSHIDEFTRFMRATKAPPRDPFLAQTSDAQAGKLLFERVGCNLCHVEELVTAPVGTLTPQFTDITGFPGGIPAALGGKTIRPFGDFLLHDVGTGDGMVQSGGIETLNKLRTPPLWGVRTRPELMHDGLSTNFLDAINRHANEAAASIQNFQALTDDQKVKLMTFLRSL